MSETLEVQVLAAIETEVLKEAGTHADRVVMGRWLPPAGVMDPIVNIIPISEPGEWTDGGGTQRTLMLLVAVIMRIDESKAAGGFKQLHDLLTRIHLRLEDLSKSNCNGLVNRFEEDRSGIEWDGFRDTDQVAAGASGWSIELERPLGTVA